MSEVVHYKGTLMKAYRLANESLEEQCKRILDRRGLNKSPELDCYYETYYDKLINECYHGFVLIDDELYEIKNMKEQDPDSQIARMTKVNNDSLQFEVRYYNGGYSLNEALGLAYDNMENKCNQYLSIKSSSK